ncbi:MAG: hypothetical protein H0U65_09720 [Rubrobacter sp.]|nr:hypothetical protein [Rubrobacter sp.]
MAEKMHAAVWAKPSASRAGFPQTRPLFQGHLAAAFWAAWLPALYAGIMWRRTTTAAALWSMTWGSVIALLLGLGRVFEITPEWLPPSVFAFLGATAILVFLSLTGRASEREIEVFESMREPDDTEESETDE